MPGDMRNKVASTNAKESEQEFTTVEANEGWSNLEYSATARNFEMRSYIIAKIFIFQ